MVPNLRYPHRLAEPASLVVWCDLPEGRLVKCPVQADLDWWIAAPRVLEDPLP